MNMKLDSIHLFLTKYPSSKTILLSLLLIIFFSIIKTIFASNVQKKKMLKNEKLILKKKIRQSLNYLLIISLFLLWFSHLQIFLVSFFAVAAAIVIAFKELIMCITGGVLIKSAKTFKEGDRIEIANIRGFVIESTFLAIKVLEIGPEKHSQQTTGDIISIPNSLVLSNTLKNESYFKGYSIKTFQFKVKSFANFNLLEQELAKKSKEICSPYLSEAKKEISKFCEKENIIIPSVDPKTKIALGETEEVIILVKIPVQNTHIADVEQELNRFFLKWKIEQAEIG